MQITESKNIKKVKKSDRKFNRIIALLICLIFSIKISCQTGLPVVVPPSPEASSLTKVIDYPVSNCTGIPDISIPLFEIQIGNLRLPVTINYHSSGRRVYDKTGAVGLGWILNAGGIISRTIYGDPDDMDRLIKFPDPWKSSGELTNKNDFRLLAGINNEQFDNIRQYDTEYDIFTYSANGLTGNFVLKDDHNIKIPVLIPKKPYKLKWHQAYSNSSQLTYCDYFELTDENGVTYRFGRSINGDSESMEFLDGQAGVNAWMLTEIISPNKEDTIYFKYRTFVSSLKSYGSFAKAILDYVGDLKNKPYNSDENNNIVTQVFYEQRISEIIFRNGRILFNLTKIEKGSENTNLMVDSIEIKNHDDITVKTIRFRYSQLNTSRIANLPVYTLDNLIIKDKNLKVTGKYLFNYYPSPVLMDEKSLDYWGFYNGSGCESICPFIPSVSGSDYIINRHANRTPLEDAMKSGVLRKITFPTGGSSEFIYEINKYFDLQKKIVCPCGGLRIYQIKSTDNSIRSLIKTYKYGIDECGYGFIRLVPGVGNMTYSTFIDINYTDKNLASTENCYNDGCCTQPFFCTSMRYKEMTFLSGIIPYLQNVAQKPVIYNQVTEYFGDPTGNTGKIAYTYDKDNRWQPSTIGSIFSGDLNFHLWEKSDLIRKEIYSKTDDPLNQYKLINYFKNNYTETVYPNEIINGLLLRKIRNSNSVPYDPGNVEEFSATQLNIDFYSFSDYSISVGKKELTNTVEAEITENGEIFKMISYVYDENHLIKEKRTIDSKGENLTINYLHPYDFAEAVYDSMVTKNIISPVIELIETKASGDLEYVKTNYEFYRGEKIIAPSTVETKINNKPYDTRLRYHDYDDKGNLLWVSEEDDLNVSYIWGHNQTFPVVQIAGISYEEIPSWVKTKISGWVFKSDQNHASMKEDVVSLKKELSSLVHNGEHLVTIYTFLPLVGMTSKTDPNGVTIFYEYDGSGRLSCVRDDDDRIIKTFEYNYRP